MGGLGLNKDAVAGFAPVHTRGLVEEIVARLRTAVVEGRLKPGQRVVEADLARQMGVSRAPVREAARILTERGLFSQIPRRGFFVREVTAKQTADALAVLASLCRQAVVGLEKSDKIEVLQDITLLSKQLTGGSLPADPVTAADAELQLLWLVASLSENVRLSEIAAMLAAELRMAACLHRPEPAATSALSVYTELAAAARARDSRRTAGLADRAIAGLSQRFTETYEDQNARISGRPTAAQKSVRAR